MTEEVVSEQVKIAFKMRRTRFNHGDTNIQ
jgi:hypothetical protein